MSDNPHHPDRQGPSASVETPNEQTSTVRRHTTSGGRRQTEIESVERSGITDETAMDADAEVVSVPRADVPKAGFADASSTESSRPTTVADNQLPEAEETSRSPVSPADAITPAEVSDPVDELVADMKPGEIATIDDLLRYAYAQGGKRFTIPGTVLAIIAARSEPEAFETDPALALVADLSSIDALLAVPPRLLVVVEDGQPPTHLRRRLVSCIAVALGRHPAFRGEILQAALTGPPGSRDEVFEALQSAVTRVTVEQLRLEGKKIKESDREKLLANATTALALLLAVRDGWSVGDLVHCLYRHLWTREQLTHGGSRRPRALIADSRTPDALRAVARVFDAEARRATSRAAAAESSADQAIQRAFDAQSVADERDHQLEVRARELNGLISRITELEAAIQAEQTNRVVDRSHHVDDYETLRTRVVRMLGKQTDLLADGLHALRSGSTSVTEEFLERAIGAFDKELDQLKNQEDGRQ